MRGVLCSLLLLGAVLARTDLAAQQPQPPSVVLPPSLDKVLRDYEKGWRAHDAAGLARLFAADGMALPSGKAPAVGRTAIEEAYRGQGGALLLRALSYAVSDSIAYIIGAYTYEDAPKGQDVGKYVLALRKGADGAWLIAADIDNAIRRSP